MITTYYPPYNFGGDGLFVSRLSNELARHGHRVDVIHCVDAYHLRTRKEPAPTPADHPNVTVHRLASRMGMLSPLLTQQTGLPLLKSARLREILATRFDVIHYHNVSLVGGPKILEYGQGIKLYTTHEYWLFCQTHVMFKFNRTACTHPHCLLCGLVYRRPPQWWRYTNLLKCAVKQIDAIISPSRFSRNLHLQKGLTVPIVHLPYFVPPAEPALGDAVDSQCAPYFLFVGRLERLKGLQTLITVFRRYPQARLLIAGTGSYESRLRQLAQGCANVQFLGKRSGHELATLYRQAVAVIIPSLCYEVLPQVALESFQQQTPVIVRNLGAMPEVIEESGGGLIYETEFELLAALERLRTDSAERQSLGCAGYAAYQRNWTPAVYLERYFALIDQIAARQRDPELVAGASSSDGQRD